MAVFGGVMAVFGEIMAGPGCSARLWRDLDVRRDYGGTWMLWRCSAMIMAGPGRSARLWRDLDVMAVFGDDYGGTWTTP